MHNTPVLEREAELAALSRARRRAGTGRGGWITVTGPVGIGKTCLLEWVAAEAAAAGWFVLEARSTRSRPDHSILLEMLRGLDLGAAPLDGPARALTALLGGETPPAHELALGLHWLLDDLASDHPVLVVVDDLPTGDAVSLQVLRRLRDRLRGLPCLVVAAATDDQPRSTRSFGTTGLVRELISDARRLTPAPLSRAAVASLVRNARPDASDAEVDALHHRTGGRPGLLRDLLVAGSGAVPPAGISGPVDTPERLAELGQQALHAGDARQPATLLDRARKQSPDDTALLGALALALAATGEVDRAVDCWHRAHDLTIGPVAALEHLAAAADALADAGRMPEAEAAYDALATAAPAASHHWVLDRRLLVGWVSGLAPLGSPSPSAAGTDPVSRLATAVALTNRSRSARRVRSLALRAARDAAAGELPARSLFLSTTLLCAVSAFDEADEVLTGILDRRIGAAGHHTRAVAAACRGHVRIRTGLVNEGLADLEQAGRPALALGVAQTAADLSAVIEGRLARGEVAEAVRLGDLLLDTRLTAGLGAALARHALGEVASATGDNTRALELFHEAASLLGPDIDNPAVLPWRVGAAFAEIRSGSPTRALTLARDNLRLARQFGSPYAEAHGLRALAAVDVTADRIGLLRQALGLALGVSAPRLRAQISTDLAALLMLTGGADAEAMGLLHEVDEYALVQELWPLQARVRRLLVRLGAVPARRPTEALSTLTPSERRTARLAAEGHTNKQIAEQTGVSVKAVEWHLSGCYRKLGIRSRRQLPTVLGAA